VGLCPRPRALAAAPRRGATDRVYAACGDAGLLVSDSLGAYWRPLPGVASAGDVATSPADGAFVAVVTPLVTISRDGGTTWDERPLSAIRVAVSPRNAQLVFAIAENGRLFASVDGGRTF
jgi:hypothetical protein